MGDNLMILRKIYVYLEKQHKQSQIGMNTYMFDCHSINPDSDLFLTKTLQIFGRSQRTTIFVHFERQSGCVTGIIDSGVGFPLEAYSNNSQRITKVRFDFVPIL